MTNIENNICEAIELIVNKTVYEASYDKTIQGVIQSCEDATIGKYKIKYQDSIFYAYNTNVDMVYAPGTAVYILIPGNDMSQNKTILGTVDHLGANYVPQIEGDKAYDLMGTNCILSQNLYKISSYYRPNQKNSYIKPIYYFDPNTQKYIGDIKIDIEGINTYLKKSKTLICGGYIQTKLPIEQQIRGNYGIIFGLDFFDNATNSFVTRYYTIDVDNMTGNPYNLKLGKRQYGIFTIDGTNFDKISSISLFVKDFPNQKENSVIEEQGLFDINISDLELMGANPMSQEELNTCGISFETPDGTIFSKGAHNYDKLRIIAKVKVKGQVLNPQVQKIPFYWFQEDVSIKNNSKFYNKYGGRGWKCLNSYNIISQETDTNAAQVEWIPATDTYLLSFNDIKAKETVLKCVVVYNNVFYTKNITITNLSTDININIESDSGTHFYYDMGRPNLTCTVEGTALSTPLKYIWGKEDSYGNFTNLPQDQEENDNIILEYNKSVSVLHALQESIKKGEKFVNAETQHLQNLKNNVESFKKKEFIENNIIHNVAVNQITNLVKYKCSVFDNNDYFLGTGSITLSNSLEKKDGYRLVIKNGIQNFQYDEFGMSPSSSSLIKPKVLPALEFTIFDNFGRPIEKDALSQCDILWKIPRKHSMLTLGMIKPSEQEQDDNFYYIKNSLDLAYGIQKKYYYNYKNNNISLEVKYKDIQLTASTDFTFIKMGDAGTNGTEYTCKIIPNNNKNQGDIVPTFTTVKNSNIGYFNFKYGTNALDILSSDFSIEAPFKLQLFKSGELIFDNSESGNLLSGKESNLIDLPDVELEWSFLQNQYKNGVQDDGYFSVVKTNNKDKKEVAGAMRYIKNNKTNMAHILKCKVKYKDTILFATLPIIFVEVIDSKYTIKLKNNTGFQSVIYTNDGIFPKYDNTNPFEIEVYKEINGSTELVSLLEGPEGIKNFTWGKSGNIFNYNSKNEWLPSTDLIIVRDSLQKDLKTNQKVFKPSEKYTGQCVTNAVTCTCSAGFIHIPIHMLLNKYGLGHLNDWDGNSIQLNKEGGFILSPQVGAGKKEKDNSFTGVLIGDVQHPNKPFSDTGLFAYHQGLQTIKLDAHNGSAIFGAKAGQLIIDPSREEALLYGGDYWKKYNNNGLPESYEKNNINRPTTENPNPKGMLINLTTPTIDFASGNFHLNSAGELTAQNGTFNDGCLFKGEINTLKDANIGRNLYLDYDSTNGGKYSRIVLNADVDGFPSIAFLKSGNLHHLRLGGLDLNQTDEYYNYSNISLSDERNKHSIQMVAPDTLGKISFFAGPKNACGIFSLGPKESSWACGKYHLYIDKDGLGTTGINDAGKLIGGYGLTGRFSVTESITTVNGLVIGVD